MSAARVLWLIKGLNRGGAERLLALMAPRMDRDRFDIRIAYLLTGCDDMVPDLRANGYEPICLDGQRTLDLTWVMQLRRLLRRERFSIVHTHSPAPAAVARVMAPRHVSFVHTEHNVWDAYNPVTYAANAVTYRRNEEVIAVSDGVVSSIGGRLRVGRHAPAVQTLRHGIDPAGVPRGFQARSEARGSLGIPDDALVVGNVANLAPKKDHAGLLAAFKLVLQQVPSAYLLVVGSGPLKDPLLATAAQLGVEGRVRFLGTRPDVARLLPALDVFVLASLYEGLPLSLLEAMAAEVPCVATAVGGIPEVVRDGIDGRVVAPRDPTALAAVLVDLLNDPNQRRRLASAGRQRVLERFTIDYAVQRTAQVYERVLQSSTTRSLAT